MKNFAQNPTSAALPSIEVGDMVHLKSDEGLGYLLKCLVIETDDQFLVARAVSAHTLDGSQIKHGDETAYLDKNLQVKRELIHKVNKKPADHTE